MKGESCVIVKKCFENNSYQNQSKHTKAVDINSTNNHTVLQCVIKGNVITVRKMFQALQ